MPGPSPGCLDGRASPRDKVNRCVFDQPAFQADEDARTSCFNQ
jgi:hypothetical protein